MPKSTGDVSPIPFTALNTLGRHLEVVCFEMRRKTILVARAPSLKLEGENKEKQKHGSAHVSDFVRASV